MEQSLPLVTVVGLCYNHSRYVIETLESIKQQSYPNLEVILIDDCSKDNSTEVVEKWLKENQLNWKFIKHSSNQGVTKSLNESLDLAKGKYYKAVACDDILLPGCLEILTKTLHSLSDDYAMVYGDVIKIDEKSMEFGQSSFTERNWLKDEDVPSGKLFVRLAELCFIPAPGTLMRTTVLKQIKFDESLYFEDWDMWLSIAKQYLIKGIAKPVVKYRIHSNSMYQEKSTAFIQAALLTVKKNMGFDKNADRYFKQFIIEWSLKNYFKNGPNQAFWFWLRFLYAKSPANLFKVARSVLGIKYKKQ
jgi:glycosyltransferase involved in cell wall biosynthesis